MAWFGLGGNGSKGEKKEEHKGFAERMEPAETNFLKTHRQWLTNDQIRDFQHGYKKGKEIIVLKKDNSRKILEEVARIKEFAGVFHSQEVGKADAADQAGGNLGMAIQICQLPGLYFVKIFNTKELIDELVLAIAALALALAVDRKRFYDEGVKKMTDNGLKTDEEKELLLHAKQKFEAW